MGWGWWVGGLGFDGGLVGGRNGGGSGAGGVGGSSNDSTALVTIVVCQYMEHHCNHD